MNSKLFATLAIAGLMATSTATALAAQPPKMKYSTDIPANVITPDKMETRLGTLEFIDGVPTAKTAEKIWDNQDFSRAVESMIMTTPTASLQGF
ncbi:MAG: hypothetical protein ABF297_04620, partial [Thiogranum sp.]